MTIFGITDCVTVKVMVLSALPSELKFKTNNEFKPILVVNKWSPSVKINWQDGALQVTNKDHRMLLPTVIYMPFWHWLVKTNVLQHIRLINISAVNADNYDILYEWESEKSNILPMTAYINPTPPNDEL